MKVYVTKWVLARGILHVESSEPFRINMSAFDFVTVKVDGWRSSYPLRLGKDAYVSLKAAEEDALDRFKKQLEKKRRELAMARRDMNRIEAGKGPVVHRVPKKLSACHAFPSTTASFLSRFGQKAD